MAQFKYTTISGTNSNDEIVVKGRDGFWKENTAKKIAEKAGIVGEATITHSYIGGKSWQNGDVEKIKITL